VSTLLILAGISFATWLIIRKINTYVQAQHFESESLRDRIDVLESMIVGYIEHPYL
jgi:hypothetical protein